MLAATSSHLTCLAENKKARRLRKACPGPLIVAALAEDTAALAEDGGGHGEDGLWYTAEQWAAWEAEAEQTATAASVRRVTAVDTGENNVTM